MPFNLNYETPRPKPNVLFDRPPRSVVVCSVIVGLCLVVKILEPVLPSSRANEAKMAAARTDVEALSIAIKAFKEDLGRFPTNSEGLDVLVTPSTAGKPYINKVPKADPWGHRYIYHQPGSGGSDFDVISYGPDGLPGGGDDISNH